MYQLAAIRRARRNETKTQLRHHQETCAGERLDRADVAVFADALYSFEFGCLYSICVYVQSLYIHIYSIFVIAVLIIWPFLRKALRLC